MGEQRCFWCLGTAYLYNKIIFKCIRCKPWKYFTQDFTDIENEIKIWSRGCVDFEQNTRLATWYTTVLHIFNYYTSTHIQTLACQEFSAFSILISSTLNTTNFKAPYLILMCVLKLSEGYTLYSCQHMYKNAFAR